MYQSYYCSLEHLDIILRWGVIIIQSVITYTGVNRTVGAAEIATADVNQFFS